MRLFTRSVVVVGFLLNLSVNSLAERNIVCRSNDAKIRGARSLAGYSTSVKTLSNRIKVFSISSNEDPAKISSKLQKKNDRTRGINLSCSEDVEVRLSAASPDYYYNLQQNLGVIQSEDAWALTKGSQSVKVAVVDTGIFYTHPDLAANMLMNTGEIAGNSVDDDGNGVVDDVYGANFVSNNGNPLDDNGHGSHCAGIIGAVSDNGIGVAGISQSVSLLAVKGLNSSGRGSLSAIAAGVDYARRRGVDIMNLSLGSSSDASVLKDALKQASDAGIVLVFAAGNETTNNDVTPSYPAAYNFTNSITVAATDNDDVLASFSNYGASTTHLAAPGVDIPSTFIDNAYVYMSGTSMAAPHVAGVAALVKAYSASKSGSEIKQCILNNVDSVSGLSGKVSTGGRLNAVRALRCDGAAPAPTPTPTPDNDGGNLDPTPSDPIVVIEYSIKASKDGSSGIKVTGSGDTYFNDELRPSVDMRGSCEVKQGSKRLKKYSISSQSDENGAFKLPTKKVKLSSSVFNGSKAITVTCNIYDSSDENAEIYEASSRINVKRRGR